MSIYEEIGVKQSNNINNDNTNPQAANGSSGGELVEDVPVNSALPIDSTLTRENINSVSVSNSVGSSNNTGRNSPISAQSNDHHQPPPSFTTVVEPNRPQQSTVEPSGGYSPCASVVQHPHHQHHHSHNANVNVNPTSVSQQHTVNQLQTNGAKSAPIQSHKSTVNIVTYDDRHFGNDPDDDIDDYDYNLEETFDRRSMAGSRYSLASTKRGRHQPSHHKSMYTKSSINSNNNTFHNITLANTVANSRSSYDIRRLRCRSTNLSHMRLAPPTDSESDRSESPEINNNYIKMTIGDENDDDDYMNDHLNGGVGIGAEHDKLMSSHFVDLNMNPKRGSRGRPSDSFIRIPGLGQRRESKFYPGRIRKRVILKNGNVNLCPQHVDKRSRRYLQDMFTTMVDIRWRWNLLVFSMGFMLSWVGFAIIWWLIAFSHSDFEHLQDESWTPCVMNIQSFASALLFSIETQHTIGYGSRFTTEECPEAMFVMCLQSVTGVMIQCFMVGFVFAKLSRPQKRSQTLMFSRYAIVCQRDGKLCIMFRVGDLRDRSHIIGATISAQVIRKKVTEEGEMIPYYHSELSVKFDEIGDDLFLIWPAIIVHEIDENSPFYKMNADELTREKFEIIAILEGTVESTGQSVQARTSYLPSEILWGHRFEQLIKYRHDTGEYLVDYAKFNNTFEVDTPFDSAQELDDQRHKENELKDTI